LSRRGNLIQADKSFTYYAEVVGAGDWHLNVVRQVLVLEWKEKTPGRHRDPINKLALQHMEVVVENVQCCKVLPKFSCQYCEKIRPITEKIWPDNKMMERVYCYYIIGTFSQIGSL